MRTLYTFLVDVGKLAGQAFFFCVWGYIVFLISVSIKYRSISGAFEDGRQMLRSDDGTLSFKRVLVSLFIYAFIGVIFYSLCSWVSMLFRTWLPNNQIAIFLTDHLFIFGLER
jgi:hypothetical protein